MPQKATKPAALEVERINIEPLYIALKSKISEHWTTYMEAVSLFILGIYT